MINRIVLSFAIGIFLLIAFAVASDLTVGTSLVLTPEKQTTLKDYIKTNLGLDSKAVVEIKIEKYPKECWKLDNYNLTCKVMVTQAGLINDFFLVNTNVNDIDNCCDDEVNDLINLRLNSQADYISRIK